jgi:hypothetical protein
MVVNNFDVMAMAIAPNEADPPLLIDPDGVLSLPVSPHRLQLVSRRRCQDAQFRRGVQLQQFAQRHPREGPEAPRMLVLKQFLGFLRHKTLNHTPSIQRIALYVNDMRAHASARKC